MKFEIPLAVIQQTTECKKQFACLSGLDCLHQVNYASLHGKILFLECLTNSPCYYRHALGTEFYCNCPTRRAIYDKYQV